MLNKYRAYERQKSKLQEKLISVSFNYFLKAFRYRTGPMHGAPYWSFDGKNLKDIYNKLINITD